MTREEIKEIFGEVLFNVSVELGRKKVTIGEMLRWESGTIIRMNKTSGEPVDFLVNEKPLAYGEVMVLDEKDPLRYDTATHLKITKDSAQVLGQLNKLEGKDIFKSVKQMIFYLRLLRAPNKLKRKALIKAMKTLAPNKPFDKQKLMGFIRGCFAHRRKSLWNNLQSVIGKDANIKAKMTKVLEENEISPQLRPEKLTLAQFINLLNALHQEKLI